MSSRVCGPRELLFVYGTLMSGHSPVSPVAQEFQRQSILLGRGTLSGTLVLVRDPDFFYPGYISTGNTPVQGEVRALASSDPLWESLDEYEGIHDDPPLYQKIRRKVNLSDGRKVLCWVYEYLGGPWPVEPLPLGRFLPGNDQ